MSEGVMNHEIAMLVSSRIPDRRNVANFSASSSVTKTGARGQFVTYRQLVIDAACAYPVYTCESDGLIKFVYGRPPLNEAPIPQQTQAQAYARITTRKQGQVSAANAKLAQTNANDFGRSFHEYGRFTSHVHDNAFRQHQREQRQAIRSGLMAGLPQQAHAQARVSIQQAAAARLTAAERQEENINNLTAIWIENQTPMWTEQTFVPPQGAVIKRLGRLSIAELSHAVDVMNSISSHAFPLNADNLERKKQVLNTLLDVESKKLRYGSLRYLEAKALLADARSNHPNEYHAARSVLSIQYSAIILKQVFLTVMQVLGGDMLHPQVGGKARMRVSRQQGKLRGIGRK